MKLLSLYTSTNKTEAMIIEIFFSLYWIPFDNIAFMCQNFIKHSRVRLQQIMQKRYSDIGRKLHAFPHPSWSTWQHTNSVVVFPHIQYWTRSICIWKWEREREKLLNIQRISSYDMIGEGSFSLRVFSACFVSEAAVSQNL